MEYILVRSDRDLSLRYEFISYEERQHTTVLQYKGKEYCGLQLKTKTARDYAIMIGWKEITEEYNKWVKSKEEVPKKRTPKKKPTKRTTSKKK